MSVAHQDFICGSVALGDVFSLFLTSKSIFYNICSNLQFTLVLDREFPIL